MQTVTLKGEDFTTVHNTLCELREIEMRLNEVLSAEMVERLHRVVKGFEQGLEHAYDQDTEAFDRKYENYRSFAVEFDLGSVWSIYEVDDLYQEHPYQDYHTVIYDGHWGPEPVEAELQGRTWGTMYMLANNLITNSGDLHHMFIEGFEPVKGRPGVLRLTTGS